MGPRTPALPQGDCVHVEMSVPSAVAMTFQAGMAAAPRGFYRTTRRAAGPSRAVSIKQFLEVRLPGSVRPPCAAPRHAQLQS